METRRIYTSSGTNLFNLSMEDLVRVWRIQFLGFLYAFIDFENDNLNRWNLIV